MEKAFEGKKKLTLYKQIIFIIGALIIFLLFIIPFVILDKHIQYIFQEKCQSMNIADLHMPKVEAYHMTETNTAFSDSHIQDEIKSLKEEFKQFSRKQDLMWNKEHETSVNDVKQISDVNSNSKPFKNIFFSKIRPEYENIPTDIQQYTTEKVDERKEAFKTILRLSGNFPDTFHLGFATTSSSENSVDYKNDINPTNIQNLEEISSESIEQEQSIDQQEESSDWGLSTNKHFYDDEIFSDENDEQTEARVLQWRNLFKILDKSDKFRDELSQDATKDSSIFQETKHEEVDISDSDYISDYINSDDTSDVDDIDTSVAASLDVTEPKRDEHFWSHEFMKNAGDLISSKKISMKKHNGCRSEKDFKVVYIRRTYSEIKLWISKKVLFYMDIFPEKFFFHIYLKAQDIQALMRRNIYITHDFKKDILNPDDKTYFCNVLTEHCGYSIWCFKRKELTGDERDVIEKLVKYSEDINYNDFSFEDSYEFMQLQKSAQESDYSDSDEDLLVSARDDNEEERFKLHDMEQATTTTHSFTFDLDNTKFDKCDQSTEKIINLGNDETYMAVELWITKKRLFYINIFPNAASFTVYLEPQSIEALVHRHILFYFPYEFKEDILNPDDKTYICNGKRRNCDYFLRCFRRRNLTPDERDLMEKIVKDSEDYYNNFSVEEFDKSELGRSDYKNDNNGLDKESFVSSEGKKEDTINESHEMEQTATTIFPFIFKFSNENEDEEYYNNENEEYYNNENEEYYNNENEEYYNNENENGDYYNIEW